MKITKKEAYCSYYKKSETITFEIEFEDGKTEELEITCWVVESDIETDAGKDLSEESQKVYDSLTEEQQQEIDNFILEL